MIENFFKPWIGEKYLLGLKNRKKVLVLGESFYCKRNEKDPLFQCPVWDKCTDHSKKDSSGYNDTCPYYIHLGYDVKLEDSPSIEIQEFLNGSYYKSYEIFSEFMKEYFHLNSIQELWDRLAFTNYVQYFVRGSTPKLSKEDRVYFNSILKIIDDLKPDLIIIWGTLISQHILRRYMTDLVDYIQKGDNNYFIKLKYNGIDYICINPYHPTDKYNFWSDNINGFKNALDYFFNNY